MWFTDVCRLFPVGDPVAGGFARPWQPNSTVNKHAVRLNIEICPIVQRLIKTTLRLSKNDLLVLSFGATHFGCESPGVCELDEGWAIGGAVVAGPTGDDCVRGWSGAGVSFGFSLLSG